MGTLQLHEYPALGERYWEELLPNGLRLRVVPKPGFARAYAIFATDYGAMDTHWVDKGQAFAAPAGVAHYLEHKMFDLPDCDVMDAFTRLGASPNAFTSYGVTAYYFDCTDGFEDSLRLLLRYVSTPYFTPESVAKERGIIGQEIQMHRDNPGSRLSDNLNAALYHNHPIRQNILGSQESIGEITPETLYACHKAFYTPANMLLFVVGDLDPEQVRELAVKALPAEHCPPPQKDYGPAEPETAKQARIQEAMEVSMPMFAAGFKCTPAKPGRDVLRSSILGSLACDVLAGESSDLYTRLYRQGRIDASFSGGYVEVPGAAMLAFSGDSEDPDMVLDAILQERERLEREGLDEVRFRRLKHAALGERLRDLDSFESICYGMLDSCLEGAEYYDFPALYQALTPKDVLDFLHQNLTRERCALSVIVPKE